MANRQFWLQFPPKPVAQLKDTIQTLILSARDSGSPKSLPSDSCCNAPGKLRHNSQLLGKGTALYGCRGTRPKSAKRWATRGYRVTNSHVIHHNFGHRHAQPAL